MAQDIAHIALNENVRSVKEINAKLHEENPQAPIVHNTSIDRTLKSSFMTDSGASRFSFKMARKINPQRSFESTIKERMAYVKNLQVYVIFSISLFSILLVSLLVVA
jgi:hypothetical protein